MLESKYKQTEARFRDWAIRCPTWSFQSQPDVLATAGWPVGDKGLVCLPSPLGALLIIALATIGAVQSCLFLKKKEKSTFARSTCLVNQITARSVSTPDENRLDLLPHRVANLHYLHPHGVANLHFLKDGQSGLRPKRQK